MTTKERRKLRAKRKKRLEKEK